MEENANKLHLKCTDFNSSTRLTVYAECIYVPVSCNFFNSFLTPRFVQLFSRNSPVNLFAVYHFKYKLIIKILSSSL